MKFTSEEVTLIGNWNKNCMDLGTEAKECGTNCEFYSVCKMMVDHLASKINQDDKDLLQFWYLTCKDTNCDNPCASGETCKKLKKRLWKKEQL